VIFSREEDEVPLKLNIGDIVELKKNHPCGGNKFTIMRTGMDFRIKCNTCGTQIWINRPDLEKRVKKIFEKE
jgi:hypothetical protein